MTLKTSGAISFSELQSEHGGSNPISMSEYYRNESYVQTGSLTAGYNLDVPFYGALSLSDFYGTTGLKILDNPNAYDTGVADYFGSSVGISGNYVIVGAYAEDSPAVSGSGKAYIFDRSTGSLLHILNNPDPSSGAYFGRSVAASDTYSIVGAPGATDGGKAYVFNNSTGALVRTFNNENAFGSTASDNFGRSVSVSGDIAVIGAPYEDDSYDPTDSSSGKVYLYYISTGALIRTLNNPDPDNYAYQDYFGNSVAIDGEYIIVGAYGQDYSYDQSQDSGKAYIYRTSSSSVYRTLQIDSLQAYFGYSVAISGNYAIVGAWGYDEGSADASGRAFIYQVSTGVQTHNLINQNSYDSYSYDNFGRAVAISGNYAIVGAYQEDDAGGLNSGVAYVYDVITGALLQTLQNPNAYAGTTQDTFGTSCAMSGDFAIVGASGEDAANGLQSGKAYILNVAHNS
jgi:hypothetical protein